MFDFSAIGKVGETLEQATRDIDSRLESIEKMHRRLVVLTAMLISELYAARTGHPADVAGVIAKALAFDGTVVMGAPFWATDPERANPANHDHSGPNTCKYGCTDL